MPHPLPGILACIEQDREVGQIRPALVLPGHLVTVAWVLAGDGFRALWPDIRIDIFSCVPAQHSGAGAGLLLGVRVILHAHALHAGVDKGVGEVHQVVLPDKIIICTTVVWLVCWVITIAQNTLQLSRN